MSSSTSDMNPPDHMVCPLTLEVMMLPFQDSVTKRSYERSAILEWIWFGNCTCPLTRKPLKLEHFSVNNELMVEIYEWRRENGLLLIVEDDIDQDDDQGCDCTGPGTSTATQKRREMRNKILERRDAKLKTFAESHSNMKPQGTKSIPPVPDVPSYLEVYI